MFKTIGVLFGVLSFGLAVTLGFGRFIAPIEGVAEYVSIGCEDTISQKMLIEQVIATGSSLPVDTCTREQMAFIVSDKLMLAVGFVIVLGIIRIGIMVSQTGRKQLEIGQEM